MSDASVATALRSAASLVVIEAPAGCGKTHQGAAYARDIASSKANRLLIITHTQAACGVFAERTAGLGRHIEIRTIDSVIAQIGAAYHAGLGLPADIATWTRRTKDGHKVLAARVAQLLARYPIVASALAVRYPTIICDEHQDSSADQHAIVMALLHQGAKVRIFGDPMQHIYKDTASDGASPPCDWDTLVGQADAYADLDTPHRWSNGCGDLGNRTLSARATLKSGGAH
ncbi:MAG: UvrD-helicase domain-containing protein [Janthinobacterium lividum]